MTDAVDANSTDSWLDDADDTAEGYPASWFVREGSAIDAGGTLCGVQIEKVSIDVVASMTGTVTGIIMAGDDDFTRGDVFTRV